MARALAQKQHIEANNDRIAQPVAKASPKTASKFSGGKPSLTAKPSLDTTKHPEIMKTKDKTFSSARRPLNKELSNMHVESKKAASKMEPTPSLNEASSLLRQTKATAGALAHLEKGIEYIFQKDLKKARTELKNILESYPGELEITARAKSYLQICDREEAGQKKTAPTADQMYALGVMEHNKADYNKAISYFIQALEKHPDADYIYYSIAASMALKGEPAESIKNLRKAIELKEDSRVHAKNDPDFSVLGTYPEFMELMGTNTSSASDL